MTVTPLTLDELRDHAYQSETTFALVNTIIAEQTKTINALQEEMRSLRHKVSRINRLDHELFTAFDRRVSRLETAAAMFGNRMLAAVPNDAA